MWSGAVNNIPQGWVLCNGQSGTPNLTGRFVVGYDPQDIDYNALRKTGGQKTKSLISTNLPAHSHYLSLSTTNNGSHAHGLSAYDGGSDRPVNPRRVSTGAWNTDATYTTPSAGDHSHTISGNTSNTGSGTSFDIRPPYYVLAYIMKL